MARWKARIKLPIRHNWTFFASSYRWGATRQNVSIFAAIRSQDFRGRGRPWGIFFGFYKTRHILLSDSANCIVLRAVVLIQYRRVTNGQTDRRTDGIAVASTALAMRRAVKSEFADLYIYWLSCPEWWYTLNFPKKMNFEIHVILRELKKLDMRS